MLQSPPFLSETRADCEVTACGLTLDISRQRMTNAEWENVLALGAQKEVIARHREMVEGAVVNRTEARQALHTSLRTKDSSAPHYVEVQDALKQMKAFAHDVRTGVWLGATGKPITDVINIGIGGSEMGPNAVYQALRETKPSIRLHFLSSVDGILLDRILGELNPETTLAVVSSKSFNTRETMVNAQAVDQWYGSAGITSCSGRACHMVVVSAKPDAHKELNLPQENQFSLWDWVGGRFSVWGAIGLPLLIALGEEVFQEFLDGAYEMDCHVLNAPLDENLPVTLALLSYWASTHLVMPSHCLLPYDQRLRSMVAWLQQLEMESLGKTYTPDGGRIASPTGQGIWGYHGNEAQHSFYQWLREGTARTSIDIVWCEDPGHSHNYHHCVLVANARAQAQALVTRESGGGQYFNAVTAIRIQKLTPRTLGAMMAMYEHKTTILATLYGINAFDQPGVELGKRLCRQVEAQVLEGSHE